MHKGGCTGSKLSWLLVFVGALNWGLVGLGGFFNGDWNVVHLLLGSWPWLEWVVYILEISTRLKMDFKSVDLPAPFGPISTVTVPFCNSKFTFFKI